ncbi:SPOR domain-containing protein [bacterium]|nr:SPOR domain-containing protein [bacterium]
MEKYIAYFVHRLFYPMILITITTFLFSCESKTDKYESLMDKETPGGAVVQTEWTPSESENESEIIEEIVDSTKGNLEINTISSLEKREETSGYIFQVGAFIYEKNARGFIKKLISKGYRPFLDTQEIKGKTWNFVRMGPYPDRLSVLKAAEDFTVDEKVETIVMHQGAAIKAFTLSKSKSDERKTAAKKVEVTKPEVTRPIVKDRSLQKPMPADKIAEDSNNESFSFQIGGLYSAENARKYLEVYQQKGYSPYLFEVKDEISGDKWYSVRVGRFSSLKDAVDAAAEFSAKEDITAQARPLGN